MRTLAILFCAALLGAAAASADTWQPPKEWLAQAMCIHAKEAPWGANTGNGFYGGLQFMKTTWLNLGGAPDPAFKHPGDPAFPFSAVEAGAALPGLAPVEARRRLVALVGRGRPRLLEVATARERWRASRRGAP